jgi:putative endonuclease
LVYYEEYPDAFSAIEREKQIKGWLRSKKIGLLEENNPNWDDLSTEWFVKEEIVRS